MKMIANQQNACHIGGVENINPKVSRYIKGEQMA
jgi:hypothetical protein